ncbi:ABC transporter B family member 10-like [Cucurbita maxima]|uniref:ABC transporter B family member 10-like n=1 Tax=Cucurbita maxima TaxID=3661 RepID=A0A6J1K823_CUCMA|nr:ABC transporter B family member 10-like [Cucurbita maxima]
MYGVEHLSFGIMGKHCGNQMVASVFEVINRQTTMSGDVVEELNVVEGTIELRSVKSLRKCIGLVQQEPALFTTSIYENILYRKEGASEAEAVKLANAHSLIPPK